MTIRPDELRSRLPGYVAAPRLEEYAPRYAEHVHLERRDGVLVFRMHHQGGPAVVSIQARSAWVGAMRDVGADPENEVIIFTGTGDRWAGDLDIASFGESMRSLDVMLENQNNAMKLFEYLLYCIDVPTIAALNGPVNHFTFGLMADITICSDTTVITDGHYAIGSAPGDGMNLSLQELLGIKRAAYTAYMCQPMSADELLVLGVVNEVVPHDQLLDRAREIAAVIMRAPWTVRRATHQIVSRPWKQLIGRDQRMHLSEQGHATQLQAHYQQTDSMAAYTGYKAKSGTADNGIGEPVPGG
jgi:enoyl-CoA hydratase/carnithine racemase